MAFIPATCPSCGGNLQVPDDRDKVKCMYCGVDIVLREQEQVQKGKIGNYLNLARTAEESNNHEEAYKYYSLVLESDPKQVEAWIGKGLSAGWQSTLAAPRVEEAARCIEKAIELGLTDPALKAKAVDAAHRMAVAFFNSAESHCWKFQQHTSTYEGQGFLDRTKNLLEDQQHNQEQKLEFLNRGTAAMALAGVAWGLNPNPSLARDMIGMCNSFVRLSLSDVTNQTYTQMAAQYADWLKTNDPNWAREQEAAKVAADKAKANAKGCLVLIVVVVGLLALIGMLADSCDSSTTTTPSSQSDN
jgi:tetratricopeptide (TPR) repeat protein